MDYLIAIPVGIVLVMVGFLIVVAISRKRKDRPRADFEKGTTPAQPQDEGNPGPLAPAQQPVAETDPAREKQAL